MAILCKPDAVLETILSPGIRCLYTFCNDAGCSSAKDGDHSIKLLRTVLRGRSKRGVAGDSLVQNYLRISHAGRGVGSCRAYFCSFTSTLAMVFSHSSLRTAESPPVLSKEIVNSSSPADRCITFIGMRAKS
jgi:hypothetical protein